VVIRLSNERKFVVKKDSKTDVITYMEYENLKGLNFKPKNNINFEDMINVDEMVIINPSLIEKLIDKKCKRTMEKILLMLSVIDSDDTDEGSDSAPFDIILGEVYRLKDLLLSKYKDYMEKENFKLLMKKIEIIEKEIELRKSVLLQEQIMEEARRSKPKR